MPLLFSYGTLQEDRVQLALFGRLIEGDADVLPGFALTAVKIEDPREAAASGMTHYANVRFTGDDVHRVGGTVFEVSDAELAAADQYENPAGYDRMQATLASGKRGWVYFHPGAA